MIQTVTLAQMKNASPSYVAAVDKLLATPMAALLAPAAVHCAKCNAVCPPPSGGCGAAGYAVKADGSKICYACADAIERELLKDRSCSFVAYLSSDGATVTTWTGGKLMTVTASRPCRLSRQSFTHNRNSFRSVRARDIHGAMWCGRGSAGVAIKLRPCA